MKKLLLAATALMVVSISTYAHEKPSLPDTMVGEWCFNDKSYSRGRCKESGADGKLTVKSNSYEFWEGSCEIVKARKILRDTYLLHTNCGGEGMVSIQDTIFKLENNRLSLIPVKNRKRKRNLTPRIRAIAPSCSIRRMGT